MKNRLYIFCAGLLLTLSFEMVVIAQQSKEGQVSVRFKNGVRVVFNTETDPPASGKRAAFGSVQVNGSNNVIHRAFIDAERRVYFGYDVIVEPIGETGQIRLTFKPLSITPSKAPIPPRPPVSAGSIGSGGRSQQNARGQDAPLTKLDLPKYSEPQLIRAGDTLALDVLINRQTGVKVIDLIKVTTSSPDQSTTNGNGEPGASGGSGGGSRAATDFTINEVGLKMTNSRLLVDGKTLFGGEADDNRLGVSGSLIWFYLADRGRFTLSLTPREGYDFQKIGTIKDNRITFTLNNINYEWISSQPIVMGSGGHWNVWVKHEPAYRPDMTFGSASRYLVGASDISEYARKKK